MNKNTTEKELRSLFQVLEKNAKALWTEATKEDYLTTFRSFAPTKTLCGPFPKHDCCPSLGYCTRNPIVLAANGEKIAVPTMRKYSNNHLEYIYDEGGRIRYVKSVCGLDGHLFGVFLVLEGRADFFDEEGKLQEIVLWGEEDGLSFETEISFRYLSQVVKRIMLDKAHFLSFQSGPTAREVTLFRLEGKDLYECVKLFREDKADNEIEGNGVVGREWLIDVRDTIKTETSKLGKHPSEDEVGAALESVFKKLIPGQGRD
ncbi:MAG: hypothetical protein LKJ88_06975 [Bacilli bacterium]|jgi:hypothetical protein|nr:hypothetical protein [Bacilli bacterium]